MAMVMGSRFSCNPIIRAEGVTNNGPTCYNSAACQDALMSGILVASD